MSGDDPGLGSGKSTLLASWLADRSEAAAWLQVEEHDSDPARFWSYLVRAIGRRRPQLLVLHPAADAALRVTLSRVRWPWATGVDLPGTSRHRLRGSS